MAVLTVMAIGLSESPETSSLLVGLPNAKLLQLQAYLTQPRDLSRRQLRLDENHLTAIAHQSALSDPPIHATSPASSL